MTEVKHTEGPWEWNGDPLEGCDLLSLSGPVISYAAYENMWFSRYKKDEDLANAHLIAAAPDMYEALEELLQNYLDLANSGDCGFWNPEEEEEVQVARAALAKARGEEK